MYNSLKNSLRSRGGDTDDAEVTLVHRLGRSTSASESSLEPRRDSTASQPSGHSLPKSSTLLLTRTRTSSRSEARKNEPLGLHVVYEPPDGHRAVDIIFVHGLGGTSRLSWSWNRDLSLFWPQEWLPLEPGFKDARILTFGYNAYFMSQQKDLFNISDFAKDLLLQMKTGHDENVASLNIGQVPIIFVVHSMGGLVVKKAYILGSQDPQYQRILDTVCSIVFLATPHRGSNLADILNRFLNVSFQSPKQYVSDLQKNSARIVDINDQFKFYADKMDIVSFFETQPTPLGIKKAIVVDRDSAVLNYPNEISSPLNANHHTVSKYSTRHDENYISVRNVVKSLVDKFRPKGRSRRRSVDQDSYRSLPGIDEVMSRLGAVDKPSDTVDALLEQYVWGSCDWILSDSQFVSFLEDDKSQPAVLQITGHPGSGKSVLASFLIQHLESLNHRTQFWFFRYNDHVQRSTRQCLLSLVFQIANQWPEYSSRLVSLGRDIDSIARSDVRSLWSKLLLTLMDKLSGSCEPLFWIVDAVDESDSPQTFLGLLGSFKAARIPLRVIFLTRAQTVTKHFDRLKASLPPSRVTQVSMSTPEDSLEMYILDQLQWTPWPDDLKSLITKALLKKSQGSFLWLSLVMKELVSCDTAEELEQVLEETPQELTEIYERIEKAVSRDLKPSDAPLLKAILSWVTCSERQLTEEELKEALKPNFSVLNLKHTSSRLCGDFVVIDKKGNMSMVHHTAKEFLTKSAHSILAVDQGDAHSLIFNKCLGILEDPRFRIRLKSQGCVGLLRYCCLSWSYHMARSSLTEYGNDYVLRLAAFFKSTACLAWIDAVARTGQLQVLTHTARALTSHVEQTRRIYMDESPLAQPWAEMEFLSIWSTELVRVVGKFGSHLARYPSSVYSLVTLFCPPESAIGRQFSMRGPSAPRITGISNTTWDDSLAKFTVGQRPRAIFCLDSYFGILTSERSVNLYSTWTFEETRRFRHGENIFAAQFNLDGSLLVTCGPRTIKVWDTSSSRPLYEYSNPNRMRAMAASFSLDSSELIICCVDSSLQRQLLSEPENWFLVKYQGHREAEHGRGGGTPICVSFSPDGSKIALAYRTALPAVWDTQSGNLIGRIENRHGRKITAHDNVGYPVRMTWNPVTEHIIGIFNNGDIFRWYPLDQEHEEMENSIHATEISCSPDGRLLVIAQRDGSLKVLSFESFSLLYNLSCMTRASALTFSPDGRRIYDLRQSFCNVWEPNALIRMAEQDERSSDTASSHYDGSTTGSLASEASATILEPITTVVCSKTSTAYAFGNDNGVVKYWPPGSLKNIEFSGGTMGIISSVIDDSDRLIATASIDRRITVRSIFADGGIDVVEDPILEANSKSPVDQLLLVGDYLLVSSESSVSIWSLTEKSVVSTSEKHIRPRYWVAHPSTPDHVLAIEVSSITLFNVVGGELRFISSWDIDYSQLVEDIDGEISPRTSTANLALESDEQHATIDKVLFTPNGSHIFVQTSKPSLEHRKKYFQMMVIGTEFLYSPESAGPMVTAKPLPNPIQSLIELPLGFVTDNLGLRRGSQSTTIMDTPGKDSLCSLAFIDTDFWVRTWNLHDIAGSSSHPHYFLPRDWVNAECLELAQVTMDGRLLCPRNGELAVVHNGLKGLPSIEYE